MLYGILQRHDTKITDFTNKVSTVNSDLGALGIEVLLWESVVLCFGTYVQQQQQ